MISRYYKMSSEKNKTVLNEDDRLDDLVSKMAKGSKKTKKSSEINYDDVDFNDLDTKTKKAYTDLFQGMPDIYKLVDASPTDSQDVIKRKCTEKLAKYHPDKISSLLAKVPADDKVKEKKRLLIQYKLIRDAYSTLRDPEKRKFYDLQRKTIDSKNFLKQRDSFEEFVKLQDSEISEQTRKNAENAFKIGYLELDKKHNFDRKKLDDAPMSKKEASKRLEDLMMERENQDIECVQNNMFDGRAFDQKEFNKQWERNKKKEERKGKGKHREGDNSLVQWEGISAANDVGLGGSSDYVSINTDYGDLYSTDKHNSSGFASKMDSDISTDSEYESPSDDDIDVSYVDGHNKDKTDIMKRFEELQGRRKVENDDYDKREFNDKSWGSVMNNPFNVSAQFGNLMGTDVSKTLEGPRRKKQIGKDVAEAYKQLVYGKDKDTK